MKVKIKAPTLIEDWKKQLKSYSALSLFANVLIALAYGISLAFGMGLVSLSPMYIVLAMGFVACLGSIGKFLKQFKEDEEEDNVQ
jgi:hypothetical protein